jgi:hypothetical protein
MMELCRYGTSSGATGLTRQSMPLCLGTGRIAARRAMVRCASRWSRIAIVGRAVGNARQVARATTSAARDQPERVCGRMSEVRLGAGLH